MLRKLIDDLHAVEDPGRRGELATEALDVIKEANAEIAQIRQAAARELKDQGLSYKQIGERFGRDGKPLHFTRIQQILRGGPTGRWAKAARETEVTSAAGDSAGGPQA